MLLTARFQDNPGKGAGTRLKPGSASRLAPLAFIEKPERAQLARIATVQQTDTVMIECRGDVFVPVLADNLPSTVLKAWRGSLVTFMMEGSRDGYMVNGRWLTSAMPGCSVCAPPRLIRQRWGWDRANCRGLFYRTMMRDNYLFVSARNRILERRG